MNTTVSVQRDRIAKTIMLFATGAALLAFIGSVSGAFAASPDRIFAEIWQSYGFLMFAGLYLLLALWPRHYPGVWELAILNKAALSITFLLCLRSDVPDAIMIGCIDGGLAIGTSIAYFLTKAYYSWSKLGPN